MLTAAATNSRLSLHRLPQWTRKRPLLSLGAATTGMTLSGALAVEAYAEYNDQSLPRSYHRDQIQQYWKQRPISVMKRLGQIIWELGPVATQYYVQEYIMLLPTPSPVDTTGSTSELMNPPQASHNNIRLQYHAERLREALTNLGPAWVKGGQQLAIRPDLVPPVVLKELQKLCDAVRPVPDEIALQVLRDELNIDDLSSVFENLQLVASASLGQVYQARLLVPPPATKSRRTANEPQLVAIKVQRPGMRKSFSLDLFLLQQWGDFVDAFTSIFTQQAPYHRALFDAFAHGSYSELDYENEARSQKYFQQELQKRDCKVKVPNVYDDYTTQRVLTTEWIQGVKLADSPPEKIRELIPVGVELFLTQLLDIGAFHADPHPGNLLVTDEEGVLCLLDFGLTSEIEPAAREAMTTAIVHLLCRDFDSLVTHDAKKLGFLPFDFDTSELKPLLTKVLVGGVLESGSDLRKRKRKLQEISNELNEIFFRYPFQVPPFFALVTRGLGLLEGIALTGDPEFDIFRASAPYATRRAVGLMGRHATSRRDKSRWQSATGF